jgi:hypothetical protein
MTATTMQNPTKHKAWNAGTVDWKTYHILAENEGKSTACETKRRGGGCEPDRTYHRCTAAPDCKSGADSHKPNELGCRVSPLMIVAELMRTPGQPIDDG